MTDMGQETEKNEDNAAICWAPEVFIHRGMGHKLEKKSKLSLGIKCCLKFGGQMTAREAPASFCGYTQDILYHFWRTYMLLGKSKREIFLMR